VQATLQAACCTGHQGETVPTLTVIDYIDYIYDIVRVQYADV